MKKTAITLIMTMAAFTAGAQQADIDSLFNDVFGDDWDLTELLEKPAKSYLYGGLNADNRTFYAGREIGDRMVNVSGSLYFLNTNGLFAGVSGLWYSQLDPKYNNTMFTVGYSMPLNRNKSLYTRASYSRFFYSPADSAYEYSFLNHLGAGVSWKSDHLGLRLNAGLLFGREIGMNASAMVFSRHTLVRIGNAGRLRFEPDLTFYVGSESVEYETTATGYPATGTSLPTTAKDVYGLLNSRLYLPVCLYLGNLDIEFGYGINLPSSRDKSADYPVTSSFSISLSYLLPLK